MKITQAALFPFWINRGEQDSAGVVPIDISGLHGSLIVGGLAKVINTEAFCNLRS